MSRQGTKNDSCTRKQPYETKKLATTAMHIILRKRPGALFLKVYHCRFCSKWHVGHARPTR